MVTGLEKNDPSFSSLCFILAEYEISPEIFVSFSFINSSEKGELL